MAKPTDERLPRQFIHTHLAVTSTPVRPFPSPRALRAGVWITVNDKDDVRVAFEPGVLADPDAGLILSRNYGAPHFFPVADASMVWVVASKGSSKIACVAS